MTYWLRCRVTPGQFSDEYALSSVQTNGVGFSLFAPVEEVLCDAPPTETRPSEGWVPVEVYEQKGENFIVRLPQQSLENGYYVTVQANQLRTGVEAPMTQ